MPVNLASPGVLVREIDLTLGQVQTASDKTGAIVASFARGPVDEPVLSQAKMSFLKFSDNLLLLIGSMRDG